MAIDFITNQLAVGGREDALSADALSSAQIDHVLSLVSDVQVRCTRQTRLEVADRAPLSVGTIARAVDLIDAEILAGRRVLVHCHMGISRSPAIAICYLRQCCGQSTSAALAAVKQARPHASPHPALLASIVAYYDSGRHATLPKTDYRALSMEGSIG